MKIEEMECLNWYDGPLTLIGKGEDGQLYYCHWATCTEGIPQHFTYLAVPVTQEQIQNIKSGAVDLRSILIQCTKCYSDENYELMDWEMDENVIPEAGVTLYLKDEK